MQKDKRYYGRLKAAEKASKKAERYQSREDAKMDALRAQFGLDRLTAAANGQNLPETGRAQAPSMSSPQPAGHGELQIVLRLAVPPFDSSTVSLSVRNANSYGNVVFMRDLATLDIKERLLAAARERSKA